MAANVFVSYDHDDQKQVGGFKLLKNNPFLIIMVIADEYVCYDHDDQKQVGGFKLLKNNPKHPLDFRDHSLKEPVTDRSGKPIKYPPSDPKSKPVRDEIQKKFENAS